MPKACKFVGAQNPRDTLHVMKNRRDVAAKASMARHILQLCRSAFLQPQSVKRAVVLIGPPKSGSTHVQDFLADNQRELARHGWHWPSISGKMAQPKSYANFVRALLNRTCSRHLDRHAPTWLDAVVGLCHGTRQEQKIHSAQPMQALRMYEQRLRDI